MTERLRGSRLIAALLPLLFEACAVQPPPPIPAVPTTSYDGLYLGSVRLTDSGSGVPAVWCQTDPRLSLRVANNSFQYTVPHPNVPDIQSPKYTVAIYPDGSFQGQAGDMGVMGGRITGRHLEGVIQGSGCDYAISADRS